MSTRSRSNPWFRAAGERKARELAEWGRARGILGWWFAPSDWGVCAMGYFDMGGWERWTT